MTLDRVDAHDQRRGNLLVRPACRGELGHATLGSREHTGGIGAPPAYAFQLEAGVSCPPVRTKLVKRAGRINT